MYIVYFLNPTTCVFSYKENRQTAPASPTVHNTTCVFSYKETLNKNFRIHYTTQLLFLFISRSFLCSICSCITATRAHTCDW